MKVADYLTWASGYVMDHEPNTREENRARLMKNLAKKFGRLFE